MQKAGERVVVRWMQVFTALIAVILVSGCQRDSSIGDDMDVLVGSLGTTLCDFAASFARSMLAAWLL